MCSRKAGRGENSDRGRRQRRPDDYKTPARTGRPQRCRRQRWPQRAGDIRIRRLRSAVSRYLHAGNGRPGNDAAGSSAAAADTDHCDLRSEGRKGLAKFESGDFDLLFLDIFMPGMDGLETMRLVHQQQPLIPIIVISGHPLPSGSGSGPDFLTMATKLGAVSSLQKPFRPAALLAAVASCLETATCPPPPSIVACDVASGP